ncbi:MAG: hypothetical protein MUP70_11110 [Candidatus Aminicenantes bacterium]|nr:hypothetical protein [Candidatus Aminicenantes bacterium]
MKRWLFILYLLGVFYLLSWLNKKKLQKRYPFLKRMDMTLTIVAYTLLTVYCLAFLSWLYRVIF